MTGATTPDGISFAEVGDPIDPVTESATQASSVQSALNNRILFTYRWEAAANRTGQQNMGEGDIGYQKDTDTAYIYCGLNLGWKSIGYGTGKQLAGAVLVSPTGSGTDYSGTIQISFAPGYFASRPAVITQAFTSVPEKAVCSPTSVTSAGFIMKLHRNDSATDTTCFWFAVEVAA